MAIRINDELAKQFGRDTVDARFKNWLLFYLVKNKMEIPDSACNVRNAIARHIHQHAHDIPSIKQTYQQQALPLSHLDWVIDDRWQRAWIASHTETLPTLAPWLTDKEKSIAYIDNWYINGDKSSAIDGLRRGWKDQERKDKKYDLFFEENMEEKLRLLIEYVKKIKNNWSAFRHAEYSKADPYCLADRVDILIHFNNLSDEEASICLANLKRKWSQTKFRKNMADKKQCNFILTEKSIKALDKIAKSHMLSRAQILEILIRSEAKQKRYVSEWIKVAKSVE